MWTNTYHNSTVFQSLLETYSKLFCCHILFLSIFPLFFCKRWGGGGRGWVDERGWKAVGSYEREGDFRTSRLKYENVFNKTTKPDVLIHFNFLTSLLPRRHFLESRTACFPNVELAETRAPSLRARHLNLMPNVRMQCYSLLSGDPNLV